MSSVKIDQVRGIQWGAEYHWDLRFLTAPAPFDRFFPAIDVEENLFSLAKHDLEIGVSSFSVPKTSKEFDLKITFHDDEEGTLKEWLTDWVNKRIFKNNRVSPLSECINQVELKKLSGTGALMKHSLYSVYPVGDLYYHGSSESTATVYTLEFAIVESVHD